MTELLKIVKLMAVAVLLTIGLLAFTLFNTNRFQENTVARAEVVIPPTQKEQPALSGLKLFEEHCKSCHRSSRISFAARDSIWFIKMIVDGKSLVESGDPLTGSLV